MNQVVFAVILSVILVIKLQTFYAGLELMSRAPRRIRAGADLGFSRGGVGGFSKLFRNFVDLFFLGRPN